MNTFVIFGCSYSYGAGLYYHEWLKDKPDGFKIPNEHDMWVQHSERISSRDNRFREDNRFVGLLSNELDMDFYDYSGVGGNNNQIVGDAIHFVQNNQDTGVTQIENDEVIPRKIEFLLVQLTDPTRGYTEPTSTELREWDKYKSFEEHWDEYLNNLVEKIDTLYEECKKINLKFCLFSMDESIAIKLVDKDYFVPIYFDGIEYHSVDNLKLEKNGILNSNGQLIWTRGKNINVPLFICDELYQHDSRDTHLGINGHKIVKDSIIRKLEEK